MTRRIHLLRHLKSSWDDPTVADHDRPLAARGRRSGKRLRRHVRTTHLTPQLVLCSSAVRAVQTWESIRGALPTDIGVQISDDLYQADARSLLRLLNQIPEAVASVLVIGHNPAMEELARLLSGTGDRAGLERMAAKYPTGGLASLAFEGSWSELAPGGAHLERFVVPREL
jgi:phosphohistidine phosphatase